MDIKEIAESLRDRRIDKVSEATGLHENTIARIRDGKVRHARHATIVTLQQYLCRTSSCCCDEVANG